jgi:hypothetical protein
VSETQPTAAVSLIVTTPGRPDQFLMGVRRATPTSRRHPNVLSTPTMRIPEGSLQAVLAEHFGGVCSLPAQGAIEQLPESAPSAFGGAQTLASSISFIVEATLARKLSLADALVSGELRGYAAPIALAVDVVPDPATEKDELTHMLTVAVELEAGENLMPQHLPSYSRLLWVDEARLQRALEHNDVLPSESLSPATIHCRNILALLVVRCLCATTTSVGLDVAQPICLDGQLPTRKYFGTGTRDRPVCKPKGQSPRLGSASGRVTVSTKTPSTPGAGVEGAPNHQYLSLHWLTPRIPPAHPNSQRRPPRIMRSMEAV